MKKYERAIKIVFDKQSERIIDVDEVLSKKTNAFDIRRQYNERLLLPICCECGQDLGVSSSKYDRVHFKHKPGHEDCCLADSKLTPQEHKKFSEILKHKESDRHKQLKNNIGELLQDVQGVDVNSISIDNKFIIRGNQKRRPDVYCKYYDRELVFEIQLSDLSLSYILSRYNFYLNNRIYFLDFG